ncbi:MAG: hypothetical protein IKM31_07705 [Oscillospiraceae bacterium]|nr:hypothetical protein [Oscillospiraceae bacterium]
MHLEKLNFRRLKMVYRRYLFWDFPASERRPIWKMRRLWKKGLYAAWVMADEKGKILAYAAAAVLDGDVLLDYLAVVRGKRGSGCGTKMLELLKEEFSGQTVFLEAEDPADGDPTKRRRVDFYLRGGFADSGVRCNVYGVDFVILTNTALPSDEAKSRLDRLYRAVFVPKAYWKHIRF